MDCEDRECHSNKQGKCLWGEEYCEICKRRKKYIIDLQNKNKTIQPYDNADIQEENTNHE